jgi:ferredoxin
MQALHQKAKELLESGKVQVIIGYGSGSGDRVRPVFIRTPEEVSKLVWDDRCRQNLAVYLNKPEIKKMGVPAVTATPTVVRTIVQLFAENQLTSGDVITLVVENNTVQELNSPDALEAYVESHPFLFPPHVKKEIQDLAKMSMEDRFQFWQNELSRCFKCYACRSACPLCYCEKCITENNQPQWVCVASHAQGNFEWHINRAMHLAGRCVQCGSCTNACPVGIPISLLTIEASRIVAAEFGQEPGLKCDAASALSSFKVMDTETFIK